MRLLIQGAVFARRAIWERPGSFAASSDDPYPAKEPSTAPSRRKRLDEAQQHKWRVLGRVQLVGATGPVEQLTDRATNSEAETIDDLADPTDLRR